MTATFPTKPTTGYTGDGARLARAPAPHAVVIIDASMVSLEAFLLRHMIATGDDRGAASLALQAIEHLHRAMLVPPGGATQRT